METLQQNQFRNIKIKYLLKDVHCMLKLSKYDQKPVIQCAHPVDLSEYFSL